MAIEKYGYDTCTRAEKEIIDLIMEKPGRTMRPFIAQERNTEPQTVKQQLHRIYRKYGIDAKKFIPMVRLAYLRSLELGLI